MDPNFSSKIETYKKAHRLSNYISAAMLYLKDNYTLDRDLAEDDIKDRILGHWGTVPGINFIYLGLSAMASEYKKEILLVAGPGHGAPAILTNAWMEKTLSEYYPHYSYDIKGLSRLMHDFSWPGGFPSHTTPMVPGTIHEGGELGYSLATAFGAVFDNPDLTTACIIGDGEAETATLSASWHGNKFINPVSDGHVLPILHLNSYRISGPTIYSTMNDGELICYFKGLGYDPTIVSQYNSSDIYSDFLETLSWSFKQASSIKERWNQYQGTPPNWPLIILKTKKGWSGPRILKGEKIEDSNLSHGIPLQKPKTNKEEFYLLKQWLESYNVHELLDSGGVIPEIEEFYPKKNLRISSTKYAFGGEMVSDLKLPNLSDHFLRIYKKGERQESRMEDLSKYLREIFRDKKNDNFRIFSPDESESNLLEELFDTTSREYVWPLRRGEKFMSEDGNIVEFLSENVLFSMLQGYNLTGRSGLMISYEAFLNIVSSQIDQHLKYLKQSKEVKFRKPIPALNLIATSTLWRQEHNGYTHQNPTLINSLLSKHSDLVKIYLPADVNSLLVAMEESLKSMDKLNLIIACKRDLPQWLDQNEAKENIKNGFSEWKWVNNNQKNSDLDIIFASSGDYQTNETLEGIKLLNKEIPELKFKYINVSELNAFKTLLNDPKKSQEVFSGDCDIVFNFHGYPDAIKQISWNTITANRLKILGYIEEGTTTTPFDMEVLNKSSRFHVAIEALKSIKNPAYSSQTESLIRVFEQKIDEHRTYIVQNGKDMDLT